MEAYLALGSNVGDRAGALRQAVQLLRSSKKVEVMACSAIYETESVEGGGKDPFLNAVLRVRTSLSAHELLQLVQQVETSAGRPQPPRRGPRSLDIDILLYGDQRLQEANLEVPHPRMNRRNFVLRPLLDVLPGGWMRLADEQW